MTKYLISAVWLAYWLCHGYPVEANVICDEGKMTVGFEKSSFSRLNINNLRLNDPDSNACKVRSNSTHIYAVVPLNECGTQIEESAENLIFKNEITIEDNTGDLITRKCLLELKFYCQYPKRGNLTLGFSVNQKSVTVSEAGFGTFTYQFEFYTNKQFKDPIELPSYILTCDIGTRIYMQIKATSSFNDAKLFVESCRASPVDDPNYDGTYSIIDNGCKVDKTVEIHTPSHDRQFRFSMEAFKFIGLYNQVKNGIRLKHGTVQHVVTPNLSHGATLSVTHRVYQWHFLGILLRQLFTLWDYHDVNKYTWWDDTTHYCEATAYRK